VLTGTAKGSGGGDSDGNGDGGGGDNISKSDSGAILINNALVNFLLGKVNIFLLEYGTSAHVIIRVFTHCFALLTCIHFLVAVVIHH